MKQDASNMKKHRILAPPVGKIYRFYRDGFKGMILGKKLWKIILIKLFVMFVVLKLFFFPNYLNTHFQTDEEKGRYVLEQMTKSNFHLTGEKNND
jgi:uncharacterized membrane protein